MAAEYTDPKDKLLDAVDRAQANPMVKMDWDMWCERHMHFLKETWPKGAGLAMIALFQTAAADTRVSDYCGGQSAKLEEALKHFAPVCCLLGDDAMDTLTAEVRVKAGLP